MVSSKLLRLPTRGALGNGLRVVAGAVLASEGRLIVTTRNRRIELRPEHDGTTTVVSVKPVKFPVGTRIEIVFGPALPCDENTLDWAETARQLARTAKTYTGKILAVLVRRPAFPRTAFRQPRHLPVRELIAELDGCTGGKAGEIVAAAGLQRTLCKDVTRQQAAESAGDGTPSCQAGAA